MQELKNTMHDEYKSNFNILSVMADSYDSAEKIVMNYYKSNDHIISRVAHVFKASSVSFSDKTINNGVEFIGNFWVTSNKSDYKFYYQ